MVSMGNTKTYAGEIFAYIQALNAVPVPDQFDYKIRRLTKNFAELYDRFCPYQPGDRVQLSKTPEIALGSGWWGSRHFLIEGAIATVQSTDFGDGLFNFGLVFDDDSWINSAGEVVPAEPEKRLLFYFSENWLIPVHPAEPKVIS